MKLTGIKLPNKGGYWASSYLQAGTIWEANRRYWALRDLFNHIVNGEW